MKRWLMMGATIGALSISTTACSRIDTEFRVEGGLCYRIRTEYTAGCQTHQAKVLALPSNCGLPDRET